MKLFNKSFLAILLFSLLLRTYNLQSRISIGGDAGRDAMIGQVALQRGEFPLFGSFSSAGPFVFGPLFYWFNMLSYVLLPFTYQSPWYLMVAAGVATVGIMSYAAYLVGGKRLAIIVGLISALCPQFISRSTSLSQHSLIGITTALLLLFFILFYKKHAFKYAFLAGVSVGTALSMHYQALNLLIFFPALLFIPRMGLKRKIISIFLMFFGFLIPSFPILLWDSRQEFANLRNMLDYFLIVQYRLYVPNSWKLYLFKFLPDYWANVVGGSLPIAFVLMIVSGLTFIYSTIKKRIPGEIFTIGLVLGILLLIIRYYKGVRFEGYMIYTAPLIFLLSGWTLLELYDLIKERLNKKRIKLLTFFSVALFIGILVADFDNAKQFIFTSSYYNRDMQRSIDELKHIRPNTRFAVYYYNFENSGHVYAFSLLLADRKLTDKKGLPIGIAVEDKLNQKKTKIIGHAISLPIADLSKLTKEEIRKDWTPSNPEDIYDDLITRWTKKEKLKATFRLDKFILERLHLMN